MPKLGEIKEERNMKDKVETYWGFLLSVEIPRNECGHLCIAKAADSNELN